MPHELVIARHAANWNSKLYKFNLEQNSTNLQKLMIINCRDVEYNLPKHLSY